MCKAVAFFAALAIWQVLGDHEICPCPKFIGHIGGTDGKWYDNLCLLLCAREKAPALQVASQGHCQESPVAVNVLVVPPPYCTLSYDPVCANDGKSYLNMCALSMAQKKMNGLNLIHLGICRHEGQNI